MLTVRYSVAVLELYSHLLRLSTLTGIFSTTHLQLGYSMPPYTKVRILITLNSGVNVGKSRLCFMVILLTGTGMRQHTGSVHQSSLHCEAEHLNQRVPRICIEHGQSAS